MIEYILGVLGIILANVLIFAFMKGAHADDYTRILEQRLYDKEHDESKVENE